MKQFATAVSFRSWPSQPLRGPTHRPPRSSWRGYSLLTRSFSRHHLPKSPSILKLMRSKPWLVLPPPWPIAFKF